MDHQPSPREQPDHHVDAEHRVTVLELFFDLVFVFAITQVTTFLAHDLTPAGLGRGMLLAPLHSRRATTPNVSISSSSLVPTTRTVSRV